MASPAIDRQGRGREHDHPVRIGDDLVELGGDHEQRKSVVAHPRIRRYPVWAPTSMSARRAPTGAARWRATAPTALSAGCRRRAARSAVPPGGRMSNSFMKRMAIVLLLRESGRYRPRWLQRRTIPRTPIGDDARSCALGAIAEPCHMPRGDCSAPARLTWPSRYRRVRRRTPAAPFRFGRATVGEADHRRGATWRSNGATWPALP